MAHDIWLQCSIVRPGTNCQMFSYMAHAALPQSWQGVVCAIHFINLSCEKRSIDQSFDDIEGKFIGDLGCGCGVCGVLGVPSLAVPLV